HSRRVIETTLYLSFFPQLVAGPIVRAAEFLPQVRDISKPRKIALGFAAVMILGGLFKKLVLANYIATDLVDEVFTYPAGYAFGDLAFAAYGYSVQIYSDFSGYSDMAIGFAALLGFRIPLNFDRPFVAASLSEFWRRWHISLSSWLRDYLYIPLGGNRFGKWLTMRNLMLTMFLGGLWHGAAWTFILWGTAHGVLLMASRFIPRMMPAWPRRILGILFTFHIVVLTFVLFRVETIEDFWAYMAGLSRFNLEIQVATPFVIGLIAFGIVTHWVGDLRGVLIRVSARQPWYVIAVGSAVLLTVIVAMAPGEVTPFIYFQF
ncbi:MAG: MBOAT family protein, partial [Rhodobacteraceae bacterium]|nr:MBOAT family protein [Paracoccaceae bacterium]